MVCNETREPIHYGAGEIGCISSSFTADVNAEKRGDGRSKRASKRAWGRVTDRIGNQNICSVRQRGWRGRVKRDRTNRAYTRRSRDRPYIDRDLEVLHAIYAVHD